MKITAFHIRNYRSIVDSGKCYLSPDYITALIGQNESGKTSVLEALKSFYDGYISDDVLRSDLTFPEVFCYFQLDEGKVLGDYIDAGDFPEELRKKVVSKNEIGIGRIWSDSKKSVVLLAEPEIVYYFENQEVIKNKIAERIVSQIPDLVKQVETASHSLQNLESDAKRSRNELNTIFAKVEELKRNIGKAKIPDTKITLEQELVIAEQQLFAAEEHLKADLADLENKKIHLQQCTEQFSICRAFNETQTDLNTLAGELKSIAFQVQDAEHQYGIGTSDRNIRSLLKNLEQVREKQAQLQNQFNEKTVLRSVQQRIADYVLSGKNIKEAEHDAWKDYEAESKLVTVDKMGAVMFKHIPMFEFFEDFSSLLPNKIDLEDLMNENIHAEGYKAARNFLSVAGLNADFFREKNHRILKQKIENLNSEITIDFQDYWRQSVGKDDKIRIHFELEHYDNSQPEKSGKPYLEFWIKDKQERLYPKQRSRGVRWFLSFYLELKATAIDNPADRVMLIDEPGLSLHARAQEDVLKVFEDLSNNLQIIYCTHSPNLIDLNKLYRIMAVQRVRETDEKSETIILDARSLNEASSDTLSPIYSLMGTRLNDRQFIFPKNNFIVQDAVTFHYLDAMARIFDLTHEAHFIPASGGEQIPVLANILFGWKIGFGIIATDTPENKEIINYLKSTTLYPVMGEIDKKIFTLEGIAAIEDMFSTIDFKRHVLQQRVGITVSNSSYLADNKLSRVILVSDFCSKMQKENLQVKDFDEETRANFEKLFSYIRSFVSNISNVTN
ncbi:MAG: AAA family ATPase [Bacteroidales bacterium]|nr:AAA family ATPase [Bacteroidales bacterium]